MGGGKAGEVASALAVETICNHIAAAAGAWGPPLLGRPDETVSFITNRLGSAVRLANETIYASAANHASMNHRIKRSGNGDVNGWPFSRLFGGSNASTDRGRHPSRQAA